MEAVMFVGFLVIILVLVLVNACADCTPTYTCRRHRRIK